MSDKQKSGKANPRGKSGGKSSGKSESRDFFRIGEQLGIPWFRLYLADSLAEKYPGGSVSASGISRWFILHLAVQAGSGHLRSSLENIEEELTEWYNTAGFRGAARGGSPPKGFDETLVHQIAQAAPELIEKGLKSGLIGQLPEEDSPGESLKVPRPPLVLSSDGRFLYFLRRRKEEDRFLAALENRSRLSEAVDANTEAFSGTAGPPNRSNRSNQANQANQANKTNQTNRPALRVHPAFTAALPRANPATPEGALLQGLASGRRLLLLAGGPGTGKTTTVARLLELLNPAPGSLEVILAAPTGRAAARMSESLNLSDKTAGRTIHSLLGLYPGRPPRHDADRPLAADLCIVDEASMVDLPLMNALLAALPESAALLLVGDPDQLPSVEAGAVLGDLLYGAAEAAEVAGEKAARRAATEAGGAPPADAFPKVESTPRGEAAPEGQAFSRHEESEKVEAIPRGEAALKKQTNPRGVAASKRQTSSRRKGPLAGAVVKLTKVYRSDTAILEAAWAVREGDIETLKVILEKAQGAVSLHSPGSPDTMARIIAGEAQEAGEAREAFESTSEQLTEADDISKLFDGFSSRAVLSPLRLGPWGVPAMNERISWLLGSTASPFPGMPVMITRNDPTRNLWNGDRGVIVSLDGRLRAAFPDAGAVRSFPLAALPGWEPAWVQTIHKSQGSEFDSVTILLPEGAERLLSREILYTAFTRARHSVNLYAESETVEAALERRVVRHSRIREWAAGK